MVLSNSLGHTVSRYPGELSVYFLPWIVTFSPAASAISEAAWMLSARAAYPLDLNTYKSILLYPALKFMMLPIPNRLVSLRPRDPTLDAMALNCCWRFLARRVADPGPGGRQPPRWHRKLQKPANRQD